MSSKISNAIEDLNELVKICEECKKYEYLNLLYDDIQEWIDKGYDELSLEDLKRYLNENNKC